MGNPSESRVRKVGEGFKKEGGLDSGTLTHEDEDSFFLFFRPTAAVLVFRLPNEEH